MSYTLAFYTVPLDELTARLTAGEPEEVAKQAVTLLRELGKPVDSVSHSSEGGTWFRDEFVDEVLAGVVGAEAAGYLVERPLAGTEWSGYPSMGWLAKAELDAAVARLDEAGEDAIEDVDDADSQEMLEAVNDVLHMAAMSGQDLVTVYS